MAALDTYLMSSSGSAWTSSASSFASVLVEGGVNDCGYARPRDLKVLAPAVPEESATRQPVTAYGVREKMQQNAGIFGG